jgi:hypothetical protein
MEENATGERRADHEAAAECLETLACRSSCGGAGI